MGHLGRRYKAPPPLPGQAPPQSRVARTLCPPQPTMTTLAAIRLHYRAISAVPVDTTSRARSGGSQSGMPVVPPKPGGGTRVILLFAWLEAMPRSEVNEQPREQEDLLDARKDPSQNAAPPRRAVSRAFACLL